MKRKNLIIFGCIFLLCTIVTLGAGVFALFGTIPGSNSCTYKGPLSNLSDGVCAKETGAARQDSDDDRQENDNSALTEENRDTKRIAKVKEMESLLEEFFNEKDRYPTREEFLIGEDAVTFLGEIKLNFEDFLKANLKSTDKNGTQYCYFENADSYILSVDLEADENGYGVGDNTSTRCDTPIISRDFKSAVQLYDGANSSSYTFEYPVQFTLNDLKLLAVYAKDPEVEYEAETFNDNLSIASQSEFFDISKNDCTEYVQEVTKRLPATITVDPDSITSEVVKLAGEDACKVGWTSSYNGYTINQNQFVISQLETNKTHIITVSVEAQSENRDFFLNIVDSFELK